MYFILDLFIFLDPLELLSDCQTKTVRTRLTLALSLFALGQDKRRASFSHLTSIKLEYSKSYNS